jgi:hypothetical protein
VSKQSLDSLLTSSLDKRPGADRRHQLQLAASHSVISQQFACDRRPGAGPAPEFCRGCPLDDSEPLQQPDPDRLFGEFVLSGYAAIDELKHMPLPDEIRKGVDFPVGPHRLIHPCWRDLHDDIQSPTVLSTALYVNEIRPSCAGIRLFFDQADREFFAGLMLQYLETPPVTPPAKTRWRRPTARTKVSRAQPPTPPPGVDLFGAFDAPG